MAVSVESNRAGMYGLSEALREDALEILIYGSFNFKCNSHRTTRTFVLLSLSEFFGIPMEWLNCPVNT